jgi:two-component system C4-dicarboxylate transport sensor histidine kinase DctB
MFDPFFTTKGVNKGLGLGLSISYNIIKDFRGEIEVSNHPEGGAQFIIALESVRAPVAEPAH